MNDDEREIPLIISIADLLGQEIHKKLRGDPTATDLRVAMDYVRHYHKPSDPPDPMDVIQAKLGAVTPPPFSHVEQEVE